ncbi:MAG TPA: hypothetical protein VNS63_12655 [Blastocatellia bacterium]|nr:hypothetical protein [Blastocatellia bacterium]
MQTLTYENILTQLVECVPEFQPDGDDLRDGLAYLVLPAFIEFVSQETKKARNPEVLERAFGFLEIAADSKEEQVINLLCDALYEFAISDPEASKAHMGRSTRRLFRRVMKEVYK